jgi:hypothetical protein
MYSTESFISRKIKQDKRRIGYIGKKECKKKK